MTRSTDHDDLAPFDLTQLLPHAVQRSVSATPVELDGRDAVRVELLEHISRHGTPDVDYVDMPTFLELPLQVEDATIEVDVLAQLNGFWPEGARGFAGLAYRIQPQAAAFEAVYLRPTNGRRAGATSPRDQRAIQYFAYPDWRFERLRTESSGIYEQGADITINEWTNLRIQIEGRQVRAFVNDQPSLAVSPTPVPPAEGRIGLFVDIGTTAYFANLRLAAQATTTNGE